MREVLISIQPKWCELIANGKKTVEVTKNNFLDVCENWGKTVFLTREEAEQALQRKEDEGK